MGWFEHRHYWRSKTSLNLIVDPVTKGNLGALVLEDCACGAVRTIEFHPGQNPVVRVADTSKN